MNLQELAKMMNVKATDLECLLSSIIEDVKNDNATDYFLNASEKEKIDFAKAYIESAVKKMQSFCVAYFTREDKSSAFNYSVYKKLMA